MINTWPLPPYLTPFLANLVTTFFTSFLTAVTTCIATVDAEFDAEMEQELNKSWDPLPPSPTTTRPPSLLSTALATAPNLFSNWRSLYSSPSPDITSTSMTKVIPETPLPACLRTPLGRKKTPKLAPTSTITTQTNLTPLMSLQLQISPSNTLISSPLPISTTPFTPQTLPITTMVPPPTSSITPTLSAPRSSLRPLLEVEPSVLPKYPCAKIKDHKILINGYQTEVNKFQKAKASGRFPPEINPRLGIRTTQLSYSNKETYYRAEKAFKEAISDVMIAHYNELISEQQNLVEEIKQEARLEYNNEHLVDLMERNSTKMATAFKYDGRAPRPGLIRYQPRGRARGTPYHKSRRGRGNPFS